ncbi:hypothetical protein RchiOBHm_Chr2g0171801 [Rosa chinensis]|uniref:Uncharacterized protein n=1 Tax=Rosa chinensis TaxID=74649 RepID=A0A2P6S5G4_ROSCH|nr:hypothetical protein RchiOBHm_Chr2g0171801 [Rosa chinensis]
MRLFAIPENPNHKPKHPNENRKRHFPKVIDDHQVNPSQAATDPNLMKWEKAYDVMVKETRQVNIKQSISGLATEFHQIHKDGMMRKTKTAEGYQDKDAADEVHYFCNTMKHIWKKFPQGLLHLPHCIACRQQFRHKCFDFSGAMMDTLQESFLLTFSRTAGFLLRRATLCLGRLVKKTNGYQFQ